MEKEVDGQQSFGESGKDVPAGTVAVARSAEALRRLKRGKRGFNIDPPTSPNAMVRRAEPPPRREQWSRQEHQGRA